ncbi:MAG: cobyric acid synthase [Chloroflexota bacterium]|nr:cobyric acid synthase [Chloroflexota bacterium]
MVQGTASHVGKSVLVSALCRIFRQDGFRVAPFKAQNMSNNSYVTRDGGEIGRAQAVQAEAAGVEARVEMNPVLLKPEADHIAQVVRMGRPMVSARVKDYFGLKAQLWESVSSSLDTLRSEYDIVIIEGAGSPAEINLKATEIVNMRVALHASAPVLLCGDIDRGGVFAALVGTLELLEPREREAIKGFIINKFRGDASLLTDGLTMLEDRTGIPVAGVVHHYREIHIPEEDSVALDIPMRSGDSGQGATLDIAVIQLPHISNFDDFDPLAREPGVNLRYVSNAGELGDPDLVILPGSKTTIPDLAWMNSQGLGRAVQDLHNRGAAIVGICGGYQMLGHRLYDPDGIESPIPEMDGLGILPLSTVFAGTKETHRIRGEVVEATGLLKSAGGASLTGYEIHMGRTTGEGVALPFLIHDRTDVAVTPETAFDGAMDESGSVLGTYIHGLFHNVQLRRAILEELAGRNGRALPGVAELEAMDTEFDKLADWVRGSLDMDLIYDITGLDRNFDRIGLP